MSIFLDKNTTRGKIILNLKKMGGLTLEELSRDIDVTPMGIRQHLLSLEKKGIVTNFAKRHGIGRPGFVYKLTEKGDELFPKAYDDFALGVLRDIQKNDGREKVSKIFQWRRDRLFNLTKESLENRKNIDELVHGLKDLLFSEGNFVELERSDGYYHLMQYNCPIYKIAMEFDFACESDFLFYKELFGDNITKAQSITDGDPCCHFIIPAE